MSQVYSAAPPAPPKKAPPNTRAAVLASWAQSQGPPPSSPRRPAAFMRAGAHLVLLSATLIACTRPYCRFIIRGRRSSLVLEHVRPNGTSASHILPMPSLGGAPDLAALAQQLNDGLGCDPLTGRHGLVALQPQATVQHPQQDTESARRSGPVEYAQFVAELQPTNETTNEPELHLWLPLVLRVWPDGHTDAFMPQPEASEEDFWQDF